MPQVRRVAVQLHHGRNQEILIIQDIDDAVWEAPNLCPVDPSFDDGPCFGEGRDGLEGGPDFGREIRSESDTTALIIVDGREKFLRGFRVKQESHLEERFAARENTSSAGIGATFPLLISSRSHLVTSIPIVGNRWTFFSLSTE